MSGSSEDRRRTGGRGRHHHRLMLPLWHLLRLWPLLPLWHLQRLCGHRHRPLSLGLPRLNPWRWWHRLRLRGHRPLVFRPPRLSPGRLPGLWRKRLRHGLWPWHGLWLWLRKLLRHGLWLWLRKLLRHGLRLRLPHERWHGHGHGLRLRLRLRLWRRGIRIWLQLPCSWRLPLVIMEL